MPFPRRCCVVSSILLACMGCGGSTAGPGGTFTREASLNGITCKLAIKSDKDPELTWGVTDQVVAAFDNHRIIVEAKQVTFDGVTKPMPSGAKEVSIDSEQGAVTILADRKPIFAPGLK